MEQIKNENLSVSVSALGAELQSIKDVSGHEYLWQADPAVWARHSPMLFPIVCGLWQGKYRIDGKEYAMERHGFAKNMDFKVIKHTAEKLTYALTDTEDTLKMYPYHFNLSVTYRLDGNKIHVIWHVENTDNKEIHFGIGGHPAFNVPDLEEDKPVFGTLKFDNNGKIERIFGNVGGCNIPERFALPTDNGLLEFTEETFIDDALIIDNSQVHSAALLNKKMRPVVTVSFKAPAVGIWSPFGKRAPFVCIEPWYGISDYAHYTGEFKNKYLMNHLLPGASFMAEYTITIG